MLIGITSYSNENKFYIKRPYCEAILRAGGIPLIIPHITDEDKLRVIVGKV